MKFGKKHFLQCTVAAFAVLAGFTVYGADVRTPAVADKIVRLPMKQMALGIPKDTGNLLFSDSPEYATRDGMLYSDMVRGDSRMYFYHVNQTSENKKYLLSHPIRRISPLIFMCTGPGTVIPVKITTE